MRAKTMVGGGALVVFVALYLVGCGGGSSPTTPGVVTGGGGGGGASVTISIVGMNGAQSFSPNPASVPVGQTVIWVNNDPTNTHRIVQDGGAFDTGNLAPGATSAAVKISTAASLPYHCSIHPSMLGAINGTTSPGGGGGY